MGSGLTRLIAVGGILFALGAGPVPSALPAEGPSPGSPPPIRVVAYQNGVQLYELVGRLIRISEAELRVAKASLSAAIKQGSEVPELASLLRALSDASGSLAESRLVHADAEPLSQRIRSRRASSTASDDTDDLDQLIETTDEAAMVLLDLSAKIHNWKQGCSDCDPLVLAALNSLSGLEDAALAYGRGVAEQAENLQEISHANISGAIDATIYEIPPPWSGIDGEGGCVKVGNTFYGTEGNDVCGGNSSDNIFVMYGGDDWVMGYEGDDQFYMGAGNDIASGSEGDDLLLMGTGADWGFGNQGNDRIDGAGGNDELSGHEGDDTIQGGNGSDEIYGNDGLDVVDGGAGVDVIRGGGGNDVLDGGSSQDVVYGNDGHDVLDLGSGATYDNSLDAYGGDGNDRIYGGSHWDNADGGNGNDSFFDEGLCCETWTPWGDNDDFWGGPGTDFANVSEGWFKDASGQSVKDVIDYYYGEENDDSCPYIDYYVHDFTGPLADRYDTISMGAGEPEGESSANFTCRVFCAAGQCENRSAYRRTLG